MAGLYKKVSGPGAKSAIDEYLEEIEQDLSDLSAKDARTYNNLQQKRVRQFGRLPIEDLATVVNNDIAHKRWIDIHVRAAREQLRRVVQETINANADQAVLRNLKRQLETGVSNVSSDASLDPRAEDAVKAIKQLMHSMPKVAAKVHETVASDLRERFATEIADLRMEVKHVFQHAVAQIAKDVSMKAISAEDWRRLVKRYEIIDAPRMAQAQIQEQDDMQTELLAVKAKLEISEASLNKQSKLKNQYQNELTWAMIKAYGAENKLETARSDIEQLESELAAARAKVQEQTDTLREKESVETRLAALQNSFETASDESRKFQANFENSEFERRQERSRAENTLQNAKDTLTAEYEGQIERAKANSALLIAQLGDESAGLVKKSQAAETDALNHLKLKTEELQSLQQDLKDKQALLEHTEFQRDNAVKLRNTAEIGLAEERQSLRKANKLAADLGRDIEAQNRSLEKAQQSLKDEQNAHAETKASLKLSQEHSVHLTEELTASQDLVAGLRNEELAHEQVRLELEALEIRSRNLSLQSEQDLDEARQRHDQEAAAHSQTRADLENAKRETRKEAQKVSEVRQCLTDKEDHLHETKESLNGEISQLRNDMKIQRDAANSFLQHCATSLGLSAEVPSTQTLSTLHSHCKPSCAPADDTRRLLPIVIAAGHLPAAWSYLCLASAGVSPQSRFNSVIRPSVSYELPWVLDSLARVMHAAISAPSVPTDVLIVLLQGIAYVHQAMKTTTDAEDLEPAPIRMLSSIRPLALAGGKATYAVYDQVCSLVYNESVIKSWILVDSFTEKRIDTSNSALPEGITLTHCPGFIFLIRSTTDGEQLYVIERKAARFQSLAMGKLKLYLPPIDGLPDEFRQLQLMTGVDHIEAAYWEKSIS